MERRSIVSTAETVAEDVTAVWPTATTVARTEASWLLAAAPLIRPICTPVAFVLGVFGNVMTLVILGRFQRRGGLTSIDRFYVALAATDLCVNFTGPLPTAVQTLLGYDIMAQHDALCKLIKFAVNAAACSSAWVLVSMTTQRAILVLWPHRVNVFCTPKRSSAIIGCIVVFFSLAYSHILYGAAVLPGVNRCSFPDPAYWAWLIDYWLKFDMFIFSLLPFIVLLVSNVVLIVKIRDSAFSEEFTATYAQRETRKRKANAVTVTAISVSLAFVLLTFPLSALSLTVYVQPGYLPASDLKTFLDAVFFSLTYFNYSINFYLYCLTGAKFRREFWNILHSYTSSRKNNLATGHSGSTVLSDLSISKTIP